MVPDLILLAPVLRSSGSRGLGFRGALGFGFGGEGLGLHRFTVRCLQAGSKLCSGLDALPRNLEGHDVA